MSESPERVLIDGGPRRGRTLLNESAFRAALAQGKRMFTERLGVVFEVTLEDAAIVYTAHPFRPDGL